MGIHQKINELYWLNKENEDLKNRIKELEETCGVGAVKLTGMPKSKNNSNSIEQIVEKTIMLKNKIQENQLLILEEKYKIENFIKTIESSELRTIVRMRNIDLKTWEEIGRTLDIDRKTASKKYNEFIDKIYKNT